MTLSSVENLTLAAASDLGQPDRDAVKPVNRLNRNPKKA
jgi:hypothetical protein